MVLAALDLADKNHMVAFFVAAAVEALEGGRGLMTRYAVLNRLTDPEALKDFDLDGYAYAPEVSDEASWVFRRRQD